MKMASALAMRSATRVSLAAVTDGITKVAAELRPGQFVWRNALYSSAPVARITRKSPFCARALIH